MLKNDSIHLDHDLSENDVHISSPELLGEYLGCFRHNSVRYDIHSATRSKDFIDIVVYANEPKDDIYETVALVPLQRQTVGQITTYHPAYTRVDERYIGRGIMEKAYMKISKILSIIIRAGQSQSPGSTKLWWKLAKNKNCLMMLHNRSTGWEEVGIDNRNKEVVSSYGESVYDLKTSTLCFTTF